MPTRQPRTLARAAPDGVVRRLLPSAILAIVFAAATACSDPSPPEAASHTAPAATAADHSGADAASHDESREGHASHAPAVTSSSNLPAQPWASDAPLREGMRRMHRAVAALEHAEHAHLDAAQTRAAAQQVVKAAEYMISNCKLAPEADAALHGVLATLMTGAAAIQRDPANITPVGAMRDAMADYPRLFEDAAWQADTAAN